MTNSLVLHVLNTASQIFAGTTPVLIPSVEGCRPQAAGWFPAPCAYLIFDI
ncbi:MAG: hypothetical protein LBM98_09980 [Oscillospiraceae bacterium]|nr:hypothetical protein [Oscillospiraceae bacterium]